ncbi:MAG: hypothetical protein ABIH23_28120 [bacterium]
MKAAIFCWGSREIGLGHLTRSLAVAREFEWRGVDVEFFINDYPVCVQKIQLDRFPYQTFTNKREVPDLLGSSGSDFVLSDCNEATRSDILAMAEILPVINIAVQGPSKWYASVSYLHSLYMDSEKPEDACGVIYAGPEYTPLTGTFAQLHGQRHSTGPVRTILVSMGGGDAMGHTILAIQALKEVPDFAGEVVICLGAAFSDAPSVERELVGFPHKHIILQDVDDMASLMMQCDLALLSMGTTTYEACCLGLPSINLCPSAFHDNLANVYQERGVLVNFGIPSVDTVRDLAHKIHMLIRRDDLREALSKRAEECVDGQGIPRIVERIIETMGSGKRGLST